MSRKTWPGPFQLKQNLHQTARSVLLELQRDVRTPQPNPTLEKMVDHWFNGDERDESVREAIKECALMGKYEGNFCIDGNYTKSELEVIRDLIYRKLAVLFPDDVFTVCYSKQKGVGEDFCSFNSYIFKIEW